MVFFVNRSFRRNNFSVHLFLRNPLTDQLQAAFLVEMNWTPDLSLLRAEAPGIPRHWNRSVDVACTEWLKKRGLHAGGDWREQNKERVARRLKRKESENNSASKPA